MPDQLTEGWIDERGHPVMSVQLIGLEDPMVALIDTGFNGELIIYEEHAQQANLQMKRKALEIKLADGSEAELLQSDGAIDWFGKTHRITIFIIPGPAPRKGRWQIGTQLLKDCRLEINFPDKTVRLYSHG